MARVCRVHSTAGTLEKKRPFTGREPFTGTITVLQFT